MQTLGTIDTLNLSEIPDNRAPIPSRSGPLLVADTPTVQIPTDTRTEVQKKFGQQRLHRLMTASRAVEVTSDITSRREAAQQALGDMVPEQKRLLLQHASRSVPLFMAIAVGQWDVAADLVSKQPVGADERKTRNRLHVWLTVQTPIALESEPLAA